MLTPVWAFPTHDIPFLRRHPLVVRQTNDLGSCGSPEIRFATGLDGQPQAAFKPVNLKDFSHGASTEISQIASFICNRLQSPCNAPSSTVSACNSAANTVSGQSGGQAADNWNRAFGLSTNYGGNNGGNSQPTTTTRANQQPTSSSPPGQQQQTTQGDQGQQTANNPDPSQTVGGNDGGISSLGRTNADGGSTPTITTNPSGATVTLIQTANPTESAGAGQVDDFDVVQCALVPILVTVTIPAPGAVQTDTSGNTNSNGSQNSGSDSDGNNGVVSPMSFGKCTDPTIKVGFGLDGRQATDLVFINNNISEFPHGGALDIITITDFTCSNLINRCGLTANDEVYNACEVAEMVSNTYGNTGMAADVFNKALGFVTNYASVDGSS
ncbi:hypothetical protein FRC03_010360 [Tulasnella sp. 419]|nr:hypothetical protein FRC03_010360 [Tulasnella sp. 419]